MTYIVRVVGYDSYWTGNTEPGKLWSNNIAESQIFDTEEEAKVVSNSGNNMDAVEYDFAVVDIQQAPPYCGDTNEKFIEETEIEKVKVIDIDNKDFEQC